MRKRLIVAALAATALVVSRDQPWQQPASRP
jgi:hypothetical protein